MKNITINGEFYYEVYFEIFVSNKYGETQTISTVDSYDKIWQEMDCLYLRNPEYIGKLDWDVWGCLDEDGWNVVQINNYNLAEIKKLELNKENNMNYHIEIKNSLKLNERIASFVYETDRDDCLSFLEDKYNDYQFEAENEDN